MNGAPSRRSAGAQQWLQATYLRTTAGRCNPCETTIMGAQSEVDLLPAMRGQIIGRLPTDLSIPMKTHVACSAIATMLLSLLTANMAAAQLMSTCVENSPERRGEIGCS